MKKASQAGRKHREAPGSLDQAVATIRRLTRTEARLGLILGSGFQGVLRKVEVQGEVPFSKLPGFPRPTVPGHGGRVVCGSLGGVELVILAGRVHYYEGHSMEVVTRSVRLLAQLGVETIVLTNAAGGLNPRFRVGDCMVLSDHINFMGANPLRGMEARGGTRFVDLTQVYDPLLQTLLRRAARQVKMTLRQGVYLAVSGPSYETPAEIRAFRRLGADAVGMSTVPEAVVARQEGLRVAGLSCITNLAAGLGDTGLAHEEVLETGVRGSAQAARLLQQFVTLYARH